MYCIPIIIRKVGPLTLVNPAPQHHQSLQKRAKPDQSLIQRHNRDPPLWIGFHYRCSWTYRIVSLLSAPPWLDICNTPSLPIVWEFLFCKRYELVIIPTRSPFVRCVSREIERQPPPHLPTPSPHPQETSLLQEAPHYEIRCLAWKTSADLLLRGLRT